MLEKRENLQESSANEKAGKNTEELKKPVSEIRNDGNDVEKTVIATEAEKQSDEQTNNKIQTDTKNEEDTNSHPKIDDEAANDDSNSDSNTISETSEYDELPRNLNADYIIENDGEESSEHSDYETLDIEAFKKFCKENPLKKNKKD